MDCLESSEFKALFKHGFPLLVLAEKGRFMGAFTESFMLLFVLLNPFIMTVYLNSLIEKMTFSTFARQIVRAALISTVVYCLFAWAGDRMFEEVMQVRFGSFQIFGGITFLIIGIRLTLGAGPPVEALDPEKKQVSGAIVMPFMVGPGTLSASILAGSRLPMDQAFLAISLAVGASITATLLIKIIHDLVTKRNERIMEKYTEVAGRVVALFTGSFAVEMIVTGVETIIRNGSA